MICTSGENAVAFGVQLLPVGFHFPLVDDTVQIQFVLVGLLVGIPGRAIAIRKLFCNSAFALTRHDANGRLHLRTSWWCCCGRLGRWWLWIGGRMAHYRCRPSKTCFKLMKDLPLLISVLYVVVPAADDDVKHWEIIWFAV